MGRPSAMSRRIFWRIWSRESSGALPSEIDGARIAAVAGAEVIAADCGSTRFAEAAGEFRRSTVPECHRDQSYCFHPGETSKLADIQ